MSRPSSFVCHDPLCERYSQNVTPPQKCEAIVALAREIEPQSPVGVLLGITIDLLMTNGIILEQAIAMLRLLYADKGRMGRTVPGGLREPVS